MRGGCIEALDASACIPRKARERPEMQRSRRIAE